MIDVEREFASCVESVGGRLTCDLVGSQPRFDNADFLFQDDQVVAELKCLVEDKASDEHIVRRASAFYEFCLQTGQAPVRVFGRVRASTNGFPDSFKQQIVELYRRPIHRRIVKANTQIKMTKAELGKVGYRGLLLLVNDGHAVLDPAHLFGMVQNTLARNRFGSISTVVMLTVNLPARFEGGDRDVLVWMELSRSPEEACSQTFLDKLGTAWFTHLSRVTGVPVATVDIKNTTSLTQLINRSTQSSH